MDNEIEISKEEAYRRNIFALITVIAIVGIIVLLIKALILGVFAIGLILLLLLYFLPSIFAFNREKRNAVAIFALNLCLGWTLIGWVIALVWALTYEENKNKKKN